MIKKILACFCLSVALITTPKIAKANVVHKTNITDVGMKRFSTGTVINSSTEKSNKTAGYCIVVAITLCAVIITYIRIKRKLKE